MNKSIILAITITIFSFQPINAQIIRDLGIKTGVSISKQKWTFNNNEESTYTDYTSGFIVALNLEWFNNDYFTMVTDFGYIQKGFDVDVIKSPIEFPETNYIETYTTQIDYLYFSPQLKIRKEFNFIIPYVFVGPRIDYQSKVETDFNWSVSELNNKEVIFGFNYGLGVVFMIKQVGVGLEYAAFSDFTYFKTSEPTQTTIEAEIKNKAFSMNLVLSYYFNQKKE